MTDDRMSGMALIAGMAGSIITMAFHPTAHDLTTSGTFSSYDAAECCGSFAGFSVRANLIPGRPWADATLGLTQ